MLTIESITKARAKPGTTGDRWMSDKAAARDVGRLFVRVARAGGTKRFYYRYSVDGRRVFVPLGLFAPSPKEGAMTLDEARAEARRLSEIHQVADSRDVRAHEVERKRREREVAELEARRIEDERRAAEAQAAELERYTVRALMAVYVDHLNRRSKARSAGDAANIAKNHLNGTALADRPAREVTSRDVTALLRGVVEAGKGRTAAKLRSYLRAAYALAIKAELDPSAASGFIGFYLTTNPVAPVGALAEFSRARDRVLTDAELAGYWSRLAEVKADAVRGALQLALLLGGQRPSQLLRLRREHVDLAGGWITLHDPKGARKQARTHELPLMPKARAILAPLVERAEALGSAWVFTSDGKVPIYPDTVAAEARKIVLAMKRTRSAREEFMLSDVRRTAETMMAAMGVSRDVRAQVQSHGLGGVQQRHYDKHDYRAEKLRALTAWARRVEAGPEPAKVVEMNAKRSRHA